MGGVVGEGRGEIKGEGEGGRVLLGGDGVKGEKGEGEGEGEGGRERGKGEGEGER